MRSNPAQTSPVRCGGPRTSLGRRRDVSWGSRRPMANERLRTALLQRGLTPSELADTVGVDPKTIERWIGGRIPYRRHRHQVAVKLGVDETYLWPGSAGGRAGGVGVGERDPGRVPAPLGGPAGHVGAVVRLGRAGDRDPGLQRPVPGRRPRHARAVPRARPTQGVRVRILLGDPDSPEVAQPAASTRASTTRSPSKIRNVDGPPTARCATLDGVEIRQHATVLYNSIYRADGELLVNPHVYGTPAALKRR